jgi:hypothetical protein
MFEGMSYVIDNLERTRLMLEFLPQRPWVIRVCKVIHPMTRRHAGKKCVAPRRWVLPEILDRGLDNFFQVLG